MGGYSQPTQIPENFRLRRAKNRVFEAKNFPPAAGQKSCIVCFQIQNFLACGGHPPNLVFKNVFFMGVRTRFCYSQNDLVAARMQFHDIVFSRVQERASTIRKTIYILVAARRRSWCFHECRNALLLFVKQSRLWHPRRHRSWRFHECRKALLLFAK